MRNTCCGPTSALSLLVTTAAALMSFAGCPDQSASSASRFVSDVSSSFDVPNVVSGKVRVRLDNRLPEPVHATVAIDILGNEVHVAERTVPAETDTLVVGPDSGEVLWVRAESLGGSGRRTLREQSYRFGADFRDGDTVVVVLAEMIPPILVCPADIELDCSAPSDPSFTRFASAASDLDDAPTVTFVDAVVQDSCPRIVERTWTATDRFGATNACVQSIRLVDRTAPALTCPADIEIDCGEDASPALHGGAIASDDCNPAPVVSHHDELEDGCPGVIRRIWSAEDACGNVSECTQTIRVRGSAEPPSIHQPPQIVCPPDITVPCGALSDPVGVEPVDCSETGVPVAVLDIDEPGPIYGEFLFGGGAHGQGPKGGSDEDFAIPLSLFTADSLGPGQPATVTVRSGRPFGFELEYNPETRILELRLAGVATGRKVAAGVPSDLRIRASATSRSSVVVSNLSYDDQPLGVGLAASAADGPQRELRVACAAPEAGFSIRGSLTLTLPSPASPIAGEEQVTFTIDALRVTYDSRGTGTPVLAPGGDPATVVTYRDVLVGDGCGGRIERTWTATDSLGRTATCTQRVFLVAQ
ncbi:MAG: hypothetical protein HRF50_06895 [Phycisphaerae bacterium]